MADINARTRLLVGTPADWAAHNLVIGDGEVVLERNGAVVKMKAGNGSAAYSALPYLTAEPAIPAAYLTESEGDALYLKLTDISPASVASKVPRMQADGKLSYAMLPLPAMVNKSVGAADAGKLTVLDAVGKFDYSMLPLPPLVNKSAGVADAGKLPLLSATGKFDPTFITVTTGKYLGTVDATAVVPVQTYIAGDYFINTGSGLAHPSWGLTAGQTVAPAQQLAFDGAKWALIGTGAAYLPLSGGTLTGDLSLAVSPSATLKLNSLLTTAPGSVRFEVAGAPKGGIYVNTGTPNQGITGSASGDFCYRAAAGGHLWSVDNGATAAMLLNTAGNVGIGTNAPGARLEIGSTSATVLRISSQTNNSYRGIVFGGVSGDATEPASLKYNFTGGDLRAAAAAAFVVDIAGTAQMRISNAGNIGFGPVPFSGNGKSIEISAIPGAASKMSLLHQSVDNNDDRFYILNNAIPPDGAYTGTFKYTRTASNASASMYVQTTGVHAWYSAPPGAAGAAIPFVEGMRLDSQGKLIIGTSSPDPVGSRTIGTAIGPTGAINMRAASSSVIGLNANAGTLITFFSDNGSAIVSAGTISVNGATTVYGGTSDYRLKNVEGPILNSGEFIDALRPVHGTWKIDGVPFVGFIAHEFQQVSPASVTGEKDAVDADGEPVYQSMQASSPEVIANIIAELQSIRVRIAELLAKAPA